MSSRHVALPQIEASLFSTSPLLHGLAFLCRLQLSQFRGPASLASFSSSIFPVVLPALQHPNLRPFSTCPRGLSARSLSTRGSTISWPLPRPPYSLSLNICSQVVSSKRLCASRNKRTLSLSPLVSRRISLKLKTERNQKEKSDHR